MIDKMREFLENASTEVSEEINKAFQIKIEGDVSIEEYLEGFYDQYDFEE